MAGGYRHVASLLYGRKPRASCLFATNIWPLTFVLTTFFCKQAMNTVDFFNELSVLFGVVEEDTKRITRPGDG